MYKNVLVAPILDVYKASQAQHSTVLAAQFLIASNSNEPQKSDRMWIAVVIIQSVLEAKITACTQYFEDENESSSIGCDRCDLLHHKQETWSDGDSDRLKRTVHVLASWLSEGDRSLLVFSFP